MGGEEVAAAGRDEIDLAARERTRDKLESADAALFIETGADLKHRGRALRSPRRHVRAHPLHADRLADRLREDHGVNSRILEPGTAVRSGILDPDHPDLLR